MASIGQLVRTVAQVSGLEEGSVKLIARYIREAGYIGQQSTGAGAAQMSFSDAASILIAVNAASLAKDAPEVVRQYGGLPLSHATLYDDNNGDGAEFYSAIERAGTFSEALSTLIEKYAGDHKSFINIEFNQPVPQVFVRLWIGENDFDDLGTTVLSCIFCHKKIVSDAICDRYVRVNITHRTLQRIAAVLST